MPATELRIILEQDGKVSVSGPINNKLLCYGLLEAARDAIKEFNDAAASSRIAVAQPRELSILKERS